MHACSLCGFPPFSESITWHEKKYTLAQQICKGLFKFQSPFWDKMTDASKDLISKLLEVDANTRITAKDALEHKWLKEPARTAPYVTKQPTTM